MDEDPTPREQLAVELANILGYGMIPFYVYFPVKAFLLQDTRLPTIGVVLVTGYHSVWILVAAVWLILSHFPKVQFTLRELFVTLLTFQIPLLLLVVAESQFVRGFGLLSFCIWVLSVVAYFSLRKAHAR